MTGADELRCEQSCSPNRRGRGIFSLSAGIAGNNFVFFGRILHFCSRNILFPACSFAPEDSAMRALSLCRSRLQALQRRVDRWHTMTFYGAISFMTLIVIATLPYRPF